MSWELNGKLPSPKRSDSAWDECKPAKLTSFKYKNEKRYSCLIFSALFMVKATGYSDGKAVQHDCPCSFLLCQCLWKFWITRKNKESKMKNLTKKLYRFAPPKGREGGKRQSSELSNFPTFCLVEPPGWSVALWAPPRSRARKRTGRNR